MTEIEPDRQTAGEKAGDATPFRGLGGTAVEETSAMDQTPEKGREIVFDIKGLRVVYPGAGAPAVDNINFDIGKNEITALIGPSGCGKSTMLRCLNRMNDLIIGTDVGGQILYHGENLYGT